MSSSSGAIITRIAEEHAQLQLCITNCDRAVQELRETNDLLENLERDIIEREQQLEKLIEERKANYKDIVKLHRSSTRRLLARMKNGGKQGLERKMEIEELRYAQTAQTEHDEVLSISALKATAENARQKKIDLESQIAIREEILQYLDKLYENAFDGPSPDFPEEDAAEQEMREAELYFERAQADLSGEKAVYEILGRASECTSRAVSILNKSDSSDADMGPAFLVLAKELSEQAQQLLDRARGLQPSVRAIQPRSVIPTQTGIDAFCTGKAFLNKWILSSRESLRIYQEEIAAECMASKGRIKSFTRAADDAQAYVMSQRNVLFATRCSILERVHEEGGVRTNSRSDESTTRSTQATSHSVGAKEVPVAVPPQDVSTVLPQVIPTTPREEDPPSYDSQSTFSFPFPEIG